VHRKSSETQVLRALEKKIDSPPGFRIGHGPERNNVARQKRREIVFESNYRELQEDYSSINGRLKSNKHFRLNLLAIAHTDKYKDSTLGYNERITLFGV